jgi:prophage tail gpP-like protein
LLTTSNNVVLLIDGKQFKFWSRIRFSAAIDRFDTIEFEAPYEFNRLEMREAFRPMTFREIVVSVNDNVIFTGTMIDPLPRLTDNESTVVVTAYALPGVLNDCTSSIDNLPSEFNKQNLHEIAEALITPFGLTLAKEAEPGPIFERVSLKPTQTVLSFLSDLANQRNQVIGNTSKGEVLFRQSATATTPVATFRQGESPLINVVPQLNGQRYYSEVTGVKPVKVGSKEDMKFTVKNRFLTGIHRPYIFEVPDVVGGDIQPAVFAKGSRMFADSVSYTIDVATWRTPDDKFLFSPNMVVRLKAPGVMINNEYTFIVREVDLDMEKNRETATMRLIMPGAYEGEPPDKLPWDE